MRYSWLIRLAALYGVLWLLTGTAGRLQVRAHVLAAVRDTVARARPDQASEELPSADSRASRDPYYYVEASVPCPFLVRVQRGYQIAPLWGSGADEWYLWLFGLRFIIARPMVWFS